MATNSSTQQRNTTRTATIQWVALATIALLAVIAAFVFLGEDNPTGGGGHNGLPASSSVSASS